MWHVIKMTFQISEGNVDYWINVIWNICFFGEKIKLYPYFPKLIPDRIKV